jgi:hypothetical protein
MIASGGAWTFLLSTDRAIALLLVGYSRPWLFFGMASVPLSRVIGLAGCLAMAPACHRTIPLAPNRPHADLDCLRYDVMTAGSCWLTCWPMMVVCCASHQWLWAMPALAAYQWMERKPRSGSNPYSRHRRCVRIAAAFAITALAASVFKL